MEELLDVQSNSSYERVSFDVWSMETGTVGMTSFLDGVYRGLEKEITG